MAECEGARELGRNRRAQPPEGRLVHCGGSGETGEPQGEGLSCAAKSSGGGGDTMSTGEDQGQTTGRGVGRQQEEVGSTGWG